MLALGLATAPMASAAPALTSVSSRGHPTGVYVFFSEDMQPASATNAANYKLTNSAGANLTISSARFAPEVATNGSQSAVRLTVPTLTELIYYTNTVQNVTNTLGERLSPNPSSAVFMHGSGVPGYFYTDFSNGVPGAIQLYGSAAWNNGIGFYPPGNPFLLITHGAFGQTGNAVLSGLTGGLGSGFRAAFKLRLMGNTMFEGAGGFSFNFSTNVPAGVFGANGFPPAERGNHNGLSVCFNTLADELYSNDPPLGICARWNGVIFARTNVSIAHQSDELDTLDDVLITLSPEGVLNVSWNNTNVLRNVALPWNGPYNGKFALAATVANGGGINTIIGVDDLRIARWGNSNLASVAISEQPTNYSAALNQSATFRVAAQGTPPYFVQWRRQGTNLPGETNFTLTTFITNVAAFQTNQFRAVVSNEFSSVTSAVAALTVTLPPQVTFVSSFGNPNAIYVLFNRDVAAASALAKTNYTVNGGITVTNVAFDSWQATNGPQSVVRLDVTPALTEEAVYFVTNRNITGLSDGLVLAPNPTVRSLRHGDDVPGFYVASFNTGQLLTNQFVFGHAYVSNNVGAGGSGGVRLTEATPARHGEFFVHRYNADQPVDALNVRFKLRLGNGSATPGEGLSFNFAPDLPGIPSATNYHRGVGSGLRVNFTTREVSTNNGIVLRWGATRITNTFVALGQPGASGTNFYDVLIRARSDGKVSVSYRGTNYLTNVQTPWQPSAGRLEWTAQTLIPPTASYYQDHNIDDVRVWIHPDDGGLGPVRFSVMPTNTSALKGQSLTWQAKLDGTPLYGQAPYYYKQWFSNGVALPGETNLSYTIPSLQYEHTLATYSLVASNFFSSTNVNVQASFTGPLLLGVTNRAESNALYLTFDMDLADDALEVTNYALSRGLSAVSASFEPTGATNGPRSVVKLLLDAPFDFRPYTVTVSNVHNFPQNALLVPNPSSASFFPAEPNADVCASDFSSFPPGASTYGVPAVQGGVLKLTTASQLNARGWFSTPRYSCLGGGFRAYFRVLVGGGSAVPGLGFSFNFTDEIPVIDLPETLNVEDGFQNCLAISFDTFDDGASEAPAVDVKWRNQTLGHVPLQVSQGPGGTNWVEVNITLSDDGKLDVRWGETNVFTQLQTPVAIGPSARFVLAARNGNANFDNHWVDDLHVRANLFAEAPVAILAQPTNTTVIESSNAYFRVRATGGSCFDVQWLRNGAPAAGANQLEYTTPPVTRADNGAQFSAIISNSFGAVTSSVATLTVLPMLHIEGANNRGNSNAVYVYYDLEVGPSALNPSNYLVQSQVTFATLPVQSVAYAPQFATHGPQSAVCLSIPAGLPPDWYSVTVTNVQPLSPGVPSADPLYTEFHSLQDLPGFFTTDFVHGGPTNIYVFGFAPDDALQMTWSPNTYGYVWWPGINGTQPVNRLITRFKLYIGGGSATPGEGFSFSFGPGLVLTPATFEESLGNGLNVSFDTHSNSPSDSVSVSVKWAGAVLASVPFQASQGPSGTNFLDTLIQLDPDGTLDVIYGTNVLFTNLATPFASVTNWDVLLAARSTSSFYDNHTIRDLTISANDAGYGPMAMIENPVSQIVSNGANATFTARVTGSTPWTLQWLRDGAAIPGATNLSLTISNVTTGDHGARFRLVASNEFSSVTSAEAALNIAPVGGIILSVQRGTGTATLQCLGLPGRAYTIQRSTDLITWSDLAPDGTADSQGRFAFLDGSAPVTQAFYRLRSGP